MSNQTRYIKKLFTNTTVIYMTNNTNGKILKKRKPTTTRGNIKRVKSTNQNAHIVPRKTSHMLLQNIYDQIEQTGSIV
jgi:hypothetical protein